MLAQLKTYHNWAVCFKMLGFAFGEAACGKYIAVTKVNPKTGGLDCLGVYANRKTNIEIDPSKLKPMEILDF